MGLLEDSIPEQYICYICRDPPGMDKPPLSAPLLGIFEQRCYEFAYIVQALSVLCYVWCFFGASDSKFGSEQKLTLVLV